MHSAKVCSRVSNMLQSMHQSAPIQSHASIVGIMASAATRGTSFSSVVDVAIASTLPPGANHLRKAIEDPLYKAKLTMQRKVKLCRHPGLRTLELPSALRERLASPLDTACSFLKLQLVMRVVKGTACNVVRLMERLCHEYGEPEDHGGDGGDN